MLEIILMSFMKDIAIYFFLNTFFVLLGATKFRGTKWNLGEESVCSVGTQTLAITWQATLYLCSLRKKKLSGLLHEIERTINFAGAKMPRQHGRDSAHAAPNKHD